MKKALITLLALTSIQTLAKEPFDISDSVSFSDGITSIQHDKISETDKMNTWYEHKQNQSNLIQEGKLSVNLGTAPLFSFPLQSTLTDPDFYGVSNYVDIDPNFPSQIEDYNCGTRSYDTNSGYNHAGIDYFLFPYAWDKMDNSHVSIHAVADGVISLKEDGHPDKSCTLNGNQWNAIFLTHSDGSETWYGHMKSGSLTNKVLGDSVVAGEFLGHVGSSGNSTGPHLHLETYDSSGLLIEPHTGACNTLNASSWWLNQKDYYQSKIAKLATHGVAPDPFPSCPTVVDTPNYKNHFVAGEFIYFTRYFRDQRQGQVSNSNFKDPNGTIAASWSDSLDGVDHYSSSYAWNRYTIPNGAQSGEWTFEVTYQGVTSTHNFYINDVIYKHGFE